MTFQYFDLMESRTVFDNVNFSLKYSRKPKQERRQKVNKLLEPIGLEGKASAYPKQLSGRQRQQVAVIRALASKLKVLLCDETTNVLDPKTTLQILALLRRLNRQLGLAIALITYEMQIAKEIRNKVVVMEDGRIIGKGSSIQIFNSPEEELTKDSIRTTTRLDQALRTIITHSAFADQIINK